MNEYREAGYLEAKEYAGYAPAEYVDIVYLTDGRTIIGTIIEEEAKYITLTDGRTIIGTIVEETADTITILTPEGERITINRTDISEMVDAITIRTREGDLITIKREDITNITKSVVPPIGAIEPWLKKYGPWLLAGGALVFSIIALSRK